MSCSWSMSSALQRRQQPDAGQQLLNFLHDNFQKSFNNNSFFASLGTSVGISIAIFLLFCLIRPHNTIVYAPKLKHSDQKHAPPPINKGYFSWLRPLIKCHEDDLVDKIGLDATVFLRFLRMLRNLFAVLSAFSVIMIGVNAGCTSKNKAILSDQDNLDPFIYMSPQIVFGECLYAHVIMSWLFNIVVCYFIWRSYRKLIKIKADYFKSDEYKSSLHSRTLMVTDVPKKWQSNEGLADIIGRIKMDPRLTEDQKARIARDMKELPKLVNEHEQTVRKLESVLAKYLKNPDRLPANRPTMKPFKTDRVSKGDGKIDAIEYLDERLKLLEARIKDVRMNIDVKKPMPYGFVSFPTISNAHTVAYKTRGKHQQGTTIKLAPRPADILWDNLSKTKTERRWNQTWGWALYLFLTIAWIVPNAFIATFLANIGRIGALWPAFAGQLYAHPNFYAVVQGFAAPLVTSLVFLVLPIIMRRISARQGDHTKTARERHATAKLFSFFVFNNLIVFTVFGTLWNFVAQVVSDTNGSAGHRKDIWEAIKDFRLATKSIVSVFNVSRFWIMYLLQRNLGALLDLIQFVTLFWRWYARKFLSPTPREMIEWSAPQPMDFAAYYNYFLFYATIAFTFAPVQPLVLPVACLYFTLDSFFRKYAFMYMFVTKTESGGLFWRLLVNRVLIASCFGNIVTAGIVWVNFNGTAACGALVPILIPIGFKIYCAKCLDDKMYYYNVAIGPDATDAEGGNGTETKFAGKDTRLSDRYGHPALTRKLLTVLVHDKAKGVLARVYQIRNEEAEPYSSTYGNDDVGMMSMQKGQEGQVGQAAAPQGMEHYGFVKEHQLDFHNLQGRARQEFGYIYDSPGGGPSRSASPAPGMVLGGAQSRSMTPGMDDGSRPNSPGLYGQTNRAKYTALGSPGLAPQSGLYPGAPGGSRPTSPLARVGSAGTDGTATGPYGYPNNSGFFGQSESDLTGLLGRQQGMGMSTPGEGYGQDYHNYQHQQPQQQPYQYQQQQHQPQYQQQYSQGGPQYQSYTPPPPQSHTPSPPPQQYQQQYQQPYQQQQQQQPYQQQGGQGGQGGYNYQQPGASYENYRKG